MTSFEISEEFWIFFDAFVFACCPQDAPYRLSMETLFGFLVEKVSNLSATPSSIFDFQIDYLFPNRCIGGAKQPSGFVSKASGTFILISLSPTVHSSPAHSASLAAAAMVRSRSITCNTYFKR
jgi:hypothetical protein